MNAALLDGDGAIGMDLNNRIGALPGRLELVGRGEVIINVDLLTNTILSMRSFVVFLEQSTIGLDLFVARDRKDVSHQRNIKMHVSAKYQCAWR